MDFDTTTEVYRVFLKRNGHNLSDILRIETQIESIKDWSQVASLESVMKWVQTKRSTCKMKITDIHLNECKNWEFDHNLGMIRHKSEKFFTVQGLRVQNSFEREVGFNGWDQPILKETGFSGGILGILRQKINSVPHYLLEAKAEPGNPELIQLSPSLQATFSNIEQSHGGRKPHLLDFFERPAILNCEVLFDQWMSEDGGRLYNKKNRCMLVQAPEGVDIKPNENFMWLSLFQIKELIKKDSIINPHVRGIISHF